MPDRAASQLHLGRCVGAGKEAEVFELGDRVLKLYKATASKSSAFREAAILAMVETFGLPAPSVDEVRQYGPRWGIVMERAEGSPFAATIDAQPTLISKYLGEMAALHLRIHRCPAPQLASLKARLTTNIGNAAVLGEKRQRRLLEGLEDLPEGDRLCHGDFHPWNILGSPGGAMIVDWLDATRGAPAADVSRSYVLMKHVAPDLASAYVEAYCAISGERAGNVYSWLPFVAGARLAEGVSDEVEELMGLVDAV
jgi:Ser/Thr protein kinase RdoA (MazF antagonist)